MCPPADAGRSASFPDVAGRSYAVEDRLAPPETRLEYIDGLEVFAAPAEEPHASFHSQVDRVIGAHVEAPYAVAVDMLTRTDWVSDFASDVSVYEPIIDPETGQKVGRKLEEIAFEIVDRQAQSVPLKKATALAARGVRRIFCVMVPAQQLFEWSRENSRWEPIAPGTMIEDRCFVRPIRAEALVRSLLVDDEIGRAMLAKRPPSIVEALDKERSEGEIAEKRRGILQIFAARGLPVPDAVRARIEATSDTAVLDRWFNQAVTATDASQID